MKYLPGFLTLLLFLPHSARGVDYLRDIQPLLAEKCSACHGALEQEAGLRLDHGQLLRQGGYGGSVINTGDIDRSLLLQRVTTEEAGERMPPEEAGEPLTRLQIELLREWIAEGAPSPTDEQIPVGPKEHWAWQPLVRPTPPTAGLARPSTSFTMRTQQETEFDLSDSNRPQGAENWCVNPIDAFVAAKQQERDVKPMPMAGPRTRLRRLYLDLIGLPPTPAQQQEFLQDTSQAGWNKVVNRLLDNPAYGERWGRHWMDVWRYSDWDGYKQQVRGSQRHIWRWRDWIIESLNEDKGYDQMVLEMLAGDELDGSDPETLRATGFLVRNYHNSNRNIWLDATVEHTAKAFLGLTINCARCHDHKYDPISQAEYYAFRAIFEPHRSRTERVPGESDTVRDGLVCAFDAQPDEPTYLFIGGNEKLPDKEHPIAPGTPSIVPVDYQVRPVQLDDLAVFPALREHVEREDMAAAQQKLVEAQASLPDVAVENEAEDLPLQVARQAVQVAMAELAALHARWQADKSRFGRHQSDLPLEALQLSAATLQWHAERAQARLKVLRQQQAVEAAQRALTAIEQQTASTKMATEDSQAEGKPSNAKADNQELAQAEGKLRQARKDLSEAEKQWKSLADKLPTASDYTPVGETYPRVSTGRRLALARWITHPDNPLTARVAVNYMWMHHFGRPLVDNVFDFGMRTSRPRHRELLDWLAVELMENDWSMKHLHRLMTTSRTYQLASAQSAAPAVAAHDRRIDPDNELMWRATVRRLEAEIIRDSLLHVAGSLDKTLGGPDIDFRRGESVPRRSVYFRHAYEKQMTMLVVFDAASPNECYRRSTSVIPQQALALSNSSLAIGQARRLAGQLRQRAIAAHKSENEQDRWFIQQAFEVLLARACSTEELAACQGFLESQSEELKHPEQLTLLPGQQTCTIPPATDGRQRARENLVHVLMNHNDFVTIR